ncbi:hypothetical protein HDU91_001168 [Kappamyces sp. JEL0680]|nr:hypothetical protein HDU91_001168 [Kappamyces sp. JEL0680]
MVQDYTLALKGSFRPTMRSDASASARVDRPTGPLIVAEDNQLFLQRHLEGLTMQMQEASLGASRAAFSYPNRNGETLAPATSRSSLIETAPAAPDSLPSYPATRTAAMSTRSKVADAASTGSAKKEIPTPTGPEDVSAKIARLLEQSNAVKEKYASVSSLSDSVKRRTAEAPGVSAGSQNEMLSNFFSSLLKKD